MVCLQTPDAMTDTTDRTPHPDLKKRARRRLVGASAIALLAAIVLPMVMDPEPRTQTQDIQIHIPSQDPGARTVQATTATETATATTAKVAAAAPTPASQAASNKQAAPPATQKTPQAATPAAPAASATPAPAAKAEPAAAAAPAPVTAPAQTDKNKQDTQDKQDKQSAERARALALLNDERWVIQLGAYKDQGNVQVLQKKIKELGYPVYTEQVDTPAGTRTRVRAGPFASRAAADAAHAQLKKIAAGGPSGGVIAQLQ